MHKMLAPRVSSRIFSLGGGKLQRKPSPWSLFFCVPGGTPLAAHSYAKKEGLGMRLLRSFVWGNSAFIHILHPITLTNFRGGSSSCLGGGGGGGEEVEHFGGEVSPAPPPPPLR